MYQSYWGIDQSPFSGRFDPRFFFESPTHEEALARLNFLVEQQRRMGLLLGPAGSGKSFLLDVFAAAMRRQHRAVVRLALPGREPLEVLGELLGRLGRPAAPDRGLPYLWRRLSDSLAEQRFQRTPVVLLLDDAARAEPEVLALLERLSRYDLSPQTQLTIVLSCEPEGLGALGRRLLDLVELRIELEPWESATASDYLQTALSRAGRRQPLFDSAAMERIHQLSGGIPRRVAQLADLALLAGAGSDADRVSAETIDAVHQELVGTAEQHVPAECAR